MRIVCIHAHPDDAEILAGGTLALLAQSGQSITIVSMTPGDCGSAVHGREQIAAIRREEARQAARLIGAEYLCAEFGDLVIFNTDESRRRVTGLIRRLHPDIVLTSSPVDYHCDHEATSDLVRDSCFAASVPNYSTDGAAPPLAAVPHLYYLDPIGGVDRFGKTIEPDFVVDVKSTFEIKRKMLAAHVSQCEWMKRQHSIDDSGDTMERWTRSRGALANIEFGEGFRRYAGHPYPQTPLLEQLLGPKAIVHDPRSKTK